VTGVVSWDVSFDCLDARLLDARLLDARLEGRWRAYAALSQDNHVYACDAIRLDLAARVNFNGLQHRLPAPVAVFQVVRKWCAIAPNTRKFQRWRYRPAVGGRKKRPHCFPVGSALRICALPRNDSHLPG
jgi:hypothetical protein